MGTHWHSLFYLPKAGCLPLRANEFKLPEQQQNTSLRPKPLDRRTGMRAIRLKRNGFVSSFFISGHTGLAVNSIRLPDRAVYNVVSGLGRQGRL